MRAARWGSALLALMATVLTLGALEIGLRLFDVDTASYHAIGGFTIYDPVLGWRLAPNREGTFRGAFFSAPVVQNAEGLRDEHYDYDRTPGRERVLALGDSFVWCWGVPHADCFTERLERSLPDTDVINAGVPAYSTAQAVLFYEREGRRYHPDLVVHVVVPNDPIENVIGPGPRFRIVDGQLSEPSVQPPRRKPLWMEWLQGHSRLFAQMTYGIAVGKQALRVWRASGWPWTTRAANAADEPGYVPEAALPPERAWQLTELLLDRLQASTRADHAKLALVFEVMPAAMTQRLRAYCTARGLPCLDLGPALTTDAPSGMRVRLGGDPHVGPAGQALVADALRAFLVRERLLGAQGAM